ncbi:hypothetical protein ACXHXM_25980
MGALSKDVDFAYLPSLNLGWQAMALRFVQIACIAAVVVVMYAFNALTDGLGHLLGNTFDAGFVVGALSVFAVFALIMWVDPSSRPRGNTSEQKGFNDRVH